MMLPLWISSQDPNPTNLVFAPVQESPKNQTITGRW